MITPRTELQVRFGGLVANLCIATVAKICIKNLASFIYFFIYNIRFVTDFIKCGFHNAMLKHVFLHNLSCLLLLLNIKSGENWFFATCLIQF